MPLNTSNIKLLKSERLTDFPDGGGAMTADEVADGQVNNLFPDISRLDKTFGRASLRKTFVKVESTGTDVYYGSHAVLVDPPNDPDVTVTMFQTGVYADQRRDAQNEVESYITASVESRFRLYGNHLQGQRQLQVYCKIDVPAPNIGDTIALQRYLTSAVDETTPVQEVQYVRIQKITSNTVQEFEEVRAQGEPLKFSRRVVTMDISTALQSLLPGNAPDYSNASIAKTKVHTTNAFDVSAYFGVSRLVAAAAQGDYVVKVDDVYAQIVPAATTESPFVDFRALEYKAGLVEVGAADAINVPLGAFTANQTRLITLPTGVKPSSLNISAAGVGTERDNGLGTFNDSGIEAVIDYVDGAMTVTTSSGYAVNALRVKYTPAVAPIVNGSTALKPVTVVNRGFNYILEAKPLPARGSFYVEYRAQNRWYRLYDNGAGNLIGDQTSLGSGTVNYLTGSVLVTLGALPDLDTALVYGWGALGDIEKVDGTIAPTRPNTVVYLDPAFPPAQVNAITVTATVGGSVKTAVSDANGNFNAQGIIGRYAGYTNGNYQPSLDLTLDFLPDDGTTLGVSYTGVNTPTNYKTGVAGATAGDINGYIVTMPTAIKEHTLRLSVALKGSWTDAWADSVYPVPTEMTAFRDNGAGAVVLEADSATVCGTINYATGVVTFNTNARRAVTKFRPAMTVQQWSSLPNNAGDVYAFKWKAPVTEVVNHQNVTANSVYYAYSEGGATTAARNLTLPLPPVKVVLPKPLGKGEVIRNSLAFEFNSKLFFAREGIIYTDYNDNTGQGVVAGSMDYAGYTATLTNYGAGGVVAIPTPVLKCLAIKNAPTDRYISTANFRLPIAPVRPGSVIIKAKRADGSDVTGAADVNGIITGSQIFGKVDQSSGIVTVVFGTETPVTTQIQAHSYYQAGAGGSEYQVGATTVVAVPAPVQPDTVLASGIGLVSIPLDPLILGMDPVRLPVDGRGIIFRVGDVAVVSNRGYETLPNGLVASQVVTLPRGNLQQVVLRDQNRVRVPTNQYTLNLTAGSVTMASGLNLNGLTQPLIAEHVQDDMSLVVDVLISGEIKLSKPLTHSYAQNTTFVSSALIFGDLQARTAGLFDQDVWDGIWKDTVSGAGAAASYNTVGYPFGVSNDGCITQRWALVFTNATTFTVIGEDVGVIGSFNTTAVCGPVNPLNNQPYFTIQPQGWGAGWSVSNALRFNTIGSLAPIWLLRTTVAGNLTDPVDDVKLQIRGDGE